MSRSRGDGSVKRIQCQGVIARRGDPFVVSVRINERVRYSEAVLRQKRLRRGVLEDKFRQILSHIPRRDETSV